MFCLFYDICGNSFCVGIDGMGNSRFCVFIKPIFYDTVLLAFACLNTLLLN